MGAEGTERERALEERIAQLEARLGRLEGRIGPEAGGAPAAFTSAPPPPILPTAGPARIQAAPGSGCGRCGKPLSPVWKDFCKHCGADYVTYPPVPGWTPGPAVEPPAPVAVPAAPGAWLAADRSSPDAGLTHGRWAGPGRNRSPLASIRLPDFSRSLEDLEAQLTGRTLAWAGGIALILGAIFFLSLAFSRGWIGPELRVLMGLVAGASALAGGAALMERGNRLLGHVLAAVGLAVISIGLAAGTRLYGLIPVEVGLLAALLAACVAAVIAIRADSQVVAAFGLVAVLVAPPLMGAAPDITTLAFIAAVLIGTTAIALWRSWAWLPPAAFVLAAPQAAIWVSGDPTTTIGLVGIGLFWLLNVVAAGGEEFRRHRDDLSPSSTTLLLANVAFTVWAGFVLLNGDPAAYRAFFLVLVALAQLGIGGWFVLRDGDRNLFGLLSIGTGIAALTMAAPVGLGAPAVPIAWSAEAVALAWLAMRRGHPYSAVVSGILYGLAGAFLISSYRPPLLSPSGVPFVDGPGASIGFFVAAVVAGIWLVRDRTPRSALAAFGLLIVGWCVPRAFDEPGTAIAYSVLLVIGTAAWRIIPELPGAPIAWRTEGLIPRAIQAVSGWRPRVDALLPAATFLAGAVATGWMLGPVALGIGYGPETRVPFLHPPGAALAVYLASLAATAWISRRPTIREPLAAVGLAVTAWISAFELDGVALVAAWSGLMVAGLAIWRGLSRLPDAEPRRIVRTLGRAWSLDRSLAATAIAGGILAAFHVAVVELPFWRFGDVLPPSIPFTDDGAVATLLLVVAVLAAGATIGDASARRLSILLALGAVAYAIPYEVFAWAVSVLWVGLGVVALAIAGVDRDERRAFLVADAALLAGAVFVLLAIVSPPARLVVGTTAVGLGSAFQSLAAGGAIALGLIALATENPRERWTRWAWLGAGVTVVYLLSVAVVDLFAMRVGGSMTTAELATQGQVALSVLWAALGVAAFVAGLRMGIEDLRRGGLALLAIATAKVFLFDLSALDVAYRVVSLIVLGLLLLASAYLWQRLGPRFRPPDDPGVTDPAPNQRAA